MTIDLALIEELRQHSTPSVFNGLKRLGRSTEQLESMDRLTIRCMSPALGVRVGFAATQKVSTSIHAKPKGASVSAPSPFGAGILDVPAPRFVVIENVGDWQGRMCVLGEVRANIYLALGCAAAVTNGPVRDLPEIEAIGFQTFANGLGTGGGVTETLEIGGTVVVGGVEISPGDIIHGDVHGVIRIPAELAADLPDAIAQTQAAERRIIAACRHASRDISEIEKAWEAYRTSS